MKVVLILCFIAFASAHTYLSKVILNGAAQNIDDCIRPQWRGDSISTFRSSPIQDVSVFPNGLLSNNMTCGFLPTAAGAVNRRCTINAGGTIGFQWQHNNANPGDDIIDGSHKGPVMAYMVKTNSGTPVDGWFKIYENGFSNGKWASTDILKANGGVFNAVIPSDITPGNYIIRAEIIALHDGDKPNGAQPYVGCVEVAVSGTGNVNPPTVSIPGVYQKTDPGIAFNLYYPTFNSYPIPGPRPYTAGSLTSSSSTAAATTTSTASTTASATTTTSGGTTTTTTTSGGSPSVTSTGGANPCTDISSCVALCGEGKVKTCACNNGQPQVECATGAASMLSYALASVFLLLAIAF